MKSLFCISIFLAALPLVAEEPRLSSRGKAFSTFQFQHKGCPVHPDQIQSIAPVGRGPQSVS